MLKIIFAIMLFFASINISNAQLENQKLIGQGRLYYYFWHVYDAKLYSENGSFSFNKPFLLKLEYKIDISGRKISNQSVKEMRSLGFNDEEKLEAWRNQMENIFPDVDEKTILTGHYNSDKSTIFYNNNKKIGEIKDPEFGKWFFGIWLDEKTSEPLLRKELLGVN